VDRAGKHHSRQKRQNSCDHARPLHVNCLRFTQLATLGWLSLNQAQFGRSLTISNSLYHNYTFHSLSNTVSATECWFLANQYSTSVSYIMFYCFITWYVFTVISPIRPLVFLFCKSNVLSLLSLVIYFLTVHQFDITIHVFATHSLYTGPICAKITT